MIILLSPWWTYEGGDSVNRGTGVTQEKDTHRPWGGPSAVSKNSFFLSGPRVQEYLALKKTPIPLGPP